jgi:hypothetical protein
LPNQLQPRTRWWWFQSWFFQWLMSTWSLSSLLQRMKTQLRTNMWWGEQRGEKFSKIKMTMHHPLHK